jgi:hypothetical protein
MVFAIGLSLVVGSVCDGIPVNSKVRLDLTYKLTEGLKFLIYTGGVCGSGLSTSPEYSE